jgi:A/G-specific adenine glycosylase
VKPGVAKIKISPATKKRLDAAVRTLLEWYTNHQRDFIWRRLRITPYIVMVSEFMLQQTQAAMIEKHLPRFLKLFPDLKSLANASTSDVLRAWQGLGYNRRALNLHRAAQALHELKRFPQTQEELIALPGIGRYTSAAILAFAFNKDIAVVDVNIERVLSRIWKRMMTYASVLPMKEIEALDFVILPKGRSSDWHAALMDLGSQICTKRDPKCRECPMLDVCASGKHFIRNPEIARAQKSESREIKYAGHPKRIWRGRILKLIVEQGPITHSRIRKQFSDPLIPVDDILTALVQEGFVTKHRNTYQLK